MSGVLWLTGSLFLGAVATAILVACAAAPHPGAHAAPRPTPAEHAYAAAWRLNGLLQPRERDFPALPAVTAPASPRTPGAVTQILPRPDGHIRVSQRGAVSVVPIAPRCITKAQATDVTRGDLPAFREPDRRWLP